MTIGEIINTIRSDAGITQEEMARRLCVTRQAISRWENGETEPSVNMIKLISETFGVPIDYFYEAKQTKSISETVTNMGKKITQLKEKALQENEQTYGAEIRKRWGDSTINASNKKIADMSGAEYLGAMELENEIKTQLERAMETGINSSEAKTLVEMHKEWLCLYWPEGLYSAETHRGLADGYLADERFQKYYEEVAPGATQFLRDAIYAWA